MNPRKTTIVILAALSASLALADDFKTINGKQYKDATVTRVEPDGVMIKMKSGMTKLYFVELPKEVQQRFNYDPQQAAAFSAAELQIMLQLKINSKSRSTWRNDSKPGQPRTSLTLAKYRRQ